MRSFLLSLTLLCSTLLGEEKKIDMDKVSETLGHLLVRHLETPSLSFNFDKVIQGMKDAKKGKAAPLNEAEYEEAMAQIQEKLFLEMSEKNLKDAVAFLEKNEKEEGVIALSSKLQYKVLHQGEGASTVTVDSTPKIHYVGKLLDGTTFSSTEGKESVELSLKETLEGFTKGLVGMKKGEKRMLYIHPDLAYGVSQHLPPNSLLLFEVELVEIDGKTHASCPSPS